MAASSIIPVKSINPSTLREALIAEFGPKAKKPLKITDAKLAALVQDAAQLSTEVKAGRISSKRKARTARLCILLACPRISAIRENHRESGTVEEWYGDKPFRRSKGMVSLLANIGDELRELAGDDDKSMFTAVNMELVDQSLKKIAATLSGLNGRPQQPRLNKSRNLKGIKSRVEQIVALVEPIPEERPRVAVKTLKALGLNPMVAEEAVDHATWMQTQQLLLSCLSQLPSEAVEGAFKLLRQATIQARRTIEPLPSDLRDPMTLDGIVGLNLAVTQLQNLLLKGGNPVVFIYGPSGSGKTQLAKAYARERLANGDSMDIWPVPFTCVGCGDGADMAMSKINDWFRSAGGISNPVLIINEVEELGVNQRKLLALLEGARGSLPAPVVLTTTKRPGEVRSTNKSLVALDEQLLRRTTLQLQTDLLGDDHILERTRAIAAAEGHVLTEAEAEEIVSEAKGRIGMALPVLNGILTSRVGADLESVSEVDDVKGEDLNADADAAK